MHYLPEFLTVAIVHLLAVMSPGPDFAVVTKNSVLYSRKIALLTALGVALGITVHVTYSLIGVGYIVAKSILLYSLIKYAGAAYLIYLGIQALKSKKSTDVTQAQTTNTALTPAEALRNGFLTNALNPKATLFFLSLFTQVIHTTTPTIIKLFYGIEMTAATLVWFSIVAIGLSHPIIKKKFNNIQHYFSKACGAVLLAIGIKVAISK